MALENLENIKELVKDEATGIKVIEKDLPIILHPMNTGSNILNGCLNTLRNMLKSYCSGYVFLTYYFFE